MCNSFSAACLFSTSFLAVVVLFFLLYFHSNLFNNIIMDVRVCWARCSHSHASSMRANKWPVDHSCLLCYNMHSTAHSTAQHTLYRTMVSIPFYTLAVAVIIVVYSLNSYSVWTEWREGKKKIKRINWCVRRRSLARYTLGRYVCAT